MITEGLLLLTEIKGRKVMTLDYSTPQIFSCLLPSW